MTIDEAIAHARAIAKYKRKKLDKCIKKNIYACKFCNEIRSCKEVAEEQEQLTEWLEELKAYRQYIDLTEIPEQYKLGFQDGIIEGNNKAIDNFAILMKETLNHDWATTKISEQIIYNRLFDKCSKIAEQLKAGGK